MARDLWERSEKDLQVFPSSRATYVEKGGVSMCIVSVISEYGRAISPQTWTPPTWQEFQELVRKAAEFDRIANQPDCEDPAKAAWMLEVESRLEKLES